LLLFVHFRQGIPPFLFDAYLCSGHGTYTVPYAALYVRVIFDWAHSCLWRSFLCSKSPSLST
jgi:hypothetical protein